MLLRIISYYYYKAWVNQPSKTNTSSVNQLSSILRSWTRLSWDWV